MESGPWGTKIQRLARIAEQRDLKVESVDYTVTMDPDLRVEVYLSGGSRVNGRIENARVFKD